MAQPIAARPDIADTACGRLENRRTNTGHTAADAARTVSTKARTAALDHKELIVTWWMAARFSREFINQTRKSPVA